jgi:hypothetical protein
VGSIASAPHLQYRQRPHRNNSFGRGDQPCYRQAPNEEDETGGGQQWTDTITDPCYTLALVRAEAPPVWLTLEENVSWTSLRKCFPFSPSVPLAL